MLAAAQARYYLTAGERANKLSYQDVLETATKQYDDMSYRQKQALYRQQYGKDPAQGGRGTGHPGDAAQPSENGTTAGTYRVF